MDMLAAHNDPKKGVGSRIASLRAKQGLSQRRFAMIIGLDRSSLNRIESGKGNPTVSTLIRIANGLAVPCPELCLYGDYEGRSLSSQEYSYERE